MSSLSLARSSWIYGVEQVDTLAVLVDIDVDVDDDVDVVAVK